MRFLVNLLLISMLLISCKKENTQPTSSDSTAKKIITAKIDGVNFSAKNFVWNDDSSYLSMTGSTTKKYITLGFNLKNDSVGTYPMPEYKFEYGTNNLSYYSRSGSYTISINDKINNIIEGNFNFSAMNIDSTKTISITNGYFKLCY